MSKSILNKVIQARFEGEFSTLKVEIHGTGKAVSRIHDAMQKEIDSIEEEDSKK